MKKTPMWLFAIEKRKGEKRKDILKQARKEAYDYGDVATHIKRGNRFGNTYNVYGHKKQRHFIRK